jgi:hypothetical protein
MTGIRCKSWNPGAMLALGIAVIAMFLAISESRAQPQNPIMPRLSMAKWQFFQNNPAAWN